MTPLSSRPRHRCPPAGDGRRSSFRARLLALFVAFLGLFPVLGWAGTVTLAWDPVSASGLSGYALSYGSAAGAYSSTLDVGNTTSRSISGLTAGATYHFAVQAYDATGTRSGYSNDLAVTVPPDAPAANFSASTTSGYAPLALNFVDSSTGVITSWTWNFGDGTVSTLQNPTKVYSWAGSYTVSLTVSGSAGSSTKTIPGYINVTAPPPAPVASFTATPTSGAAPLAVGFTSTSTGTISSYAWNFGDGTTSTAQNPAKTYSAPGVYDVSLTVTGPGGSNSKTMTGYVTVSGGAPTAAFYASTTTGAAPLAITFTSTSTGTISSYSWNFGDGTTSTAQNPAKTYSAAGTYTVSLTVTGSGGSNTSTKAGYITVAAPGPTLTGVLNLRAVNTNLTSTGAIDWVLFPSKTRKAGVSPTIGDPTVTEAPTGYGGDSRKLTWSDGPAGSTSGTSTDGIQVSPKGNSWTFILPADTTTRTVTLYAGGSNSYGTLRAYLSDSSAPVLTIDTVGGVGAYDATFTITYQAASAGQTLKVVWAGDKGTERRSLRSITPGTLRLSGVALQ